MVPRVPPPLDSHGSVRPLPSVQVPTLLAVTVVLLLFLASPSHAKPVEFSSSSLMFYNGDLQRDAAMGMSPCELYVRRAAAHGSTRIQMVPTHYWVDKRGDYGQDPKQCYPTNWADPDLSVKHYCFKADWQAACKPFTPSAVDAFRTGLQQCFETALTYFDEVLIAPHLDPLGDTSKRSKWRNMLRFDPLEKDENGYSYWDIMLKPTLDAANAAFKQKGKTFNFGMGGEMGGTIINHPGSYLKAIRDIKAGWRSPAALRTGVTFFGAFTPGQINRGPGPKAPLNSGSTGKIEGGWGPLLPLDSWPGVARIKAVQADLKALFAAVDFVGVSNYARAGANPQPSDMSVATANLLEELAAMGVDVTPFKSQGSGKQLIWNEFGLGGGIGGCNNVTGTDPSNLAAWPYLGISASEYSRAADPFKQSPAAAAYLKRYYDTALQVLSAGGADGYKVDAAYIWSVGSWDVQGIHTASAKWNTAVQQGDWPVVNGYADAAVTAAIKAHNAKAAQRRR